MKKICIYNNNLGSDNVQFEMYGGKFSAVAPPSCIDTLAICRNLPHVSSISFAFLCLLDSSVARNTHCTPKPFLSVLEEL